MSCGIIFVDLVILVGRFLAGPGDDQRRAGFVNQDGIDFIDDGVAEQLVLSAAASGDAVIGSMVRWTQSNRNFMLSRR
jgi:hypothetical protein